MSKIILIMIICYFCGAAVTAVRDNYIGHSCSTTSSAINTNYNQNLKLLLDDLANYDSSHNGSFATLIREDEYYKIHGLVLCRGDISFNDCKACVTEASTAVMNNYCPNRRSATIWRDYCEVKYSDTNFFGKVDTDENSLTVTNGVEMSDKGRRKNAENLMDTLGNEARRTMLFANGTLAGVYGMAQCTRDISGPGCKECIEKAVSHLFECCGKDESARVLFGSCHVRRENYDFLKQNRNDQNS